MSRKITSATAADVRAWATVNGITVRPGRLSSDVVKAFHDANKGSRYVVGYVEPQPVRVTAIRVSPTTGRKTPVTRSLTIGDVRAAATAAGVTLGARGRVSSAAWQAAASGNWDTFLTASE